MKKTFLIGIAVLLALAVFSCDGFSVPETKGRETIIVGYTDDGREIMEIELGTTISSSSRALHETLAKAASDFYEVIFFDGTDIYRTTWREGRTARLRLPTANYTGTNYALLFAGRYEDMMLLGVGQLTDVEGVPGTAITALTTYVDFTIQALTTNVTGVVGTSTFKPTPFEVNLIKVNEKDVPVFMIPGGNTGSPAAATFDIVNTLRGNIVYAAANGSYVSKPYAWADSTEDLPIDLANVTFTASPFTIGAAVAFPIAISITTLPDDATTGKGGLCRLGLEIPVYLKTNAAAANGGAAKVWYLKGGLNNSLLDMGYALTGMGGSVLIGSGTVLNGNGVKIGGDY